MPGGQLGRLPGRNVTGGCRVAVRQDQRTTLRQWLLAGAAAWIGLNAFVHLGARFLDLVPQRLALFVGGGLTGASEAVVLWTGRIVLLTAALLWAALYARLRERLPGPEWARGILYGLAVWVVSAMVLLPLAGWLNGTVAFGSSGWIGLIGIGYAGYPGAALSLGAHLVYGLVLAAFAGAWAR